MMKDYVTPELRFVLLDAQDVITASNDVEFDVGTWLGDTQSNNWTGGGFVS